VDRNQITQLVVEEVVTALDIPVTGLTLKKARNSKHRLALSQEDGLVGTRSDPGGEREQTGNPGNRLDRPQTKNAISGKEGQWSGQSFPGCSKLNERNVK